MILRIFVSDSVVLDAVNDSPHHILLWDLVADNTQLRPVLASPYLNDSLLVYTDKLGMDSKAAEEGS